ncbi:MAG: PTS sugar transporter subunit IIA [Alphaproteobacteria bacterium]
MIGIVLVSHGGLAHEALSVIEHIVGKQECIAPIGIEPDDDMTSRRDEILEAVKTVDRGKGVVILTDMFGGTPSNLAISVTENENVEVIAGVNLPLLVKLVSIRETEPLKKAVNLAAEAGRKYINVASQSLADE